MRAVNITFRVGHPVLSIIYKISSVVKGDICLFVIKANVHDLRDNNKMSYYLWTHHTAHQTKPPSRYNWCGTQVV